MFLAHIDGDGRPQTIFSHVTGVSTLAEGFAQSFGAQEQARLAGLAHDIGKYSLAFQRRLEGDKRRVDHATAGAVECWQMGQPFVAFVVAGHHGGLPNGGSPVDGPEDSTLCGRIKRGEAKRLEDYEAYQKEVRLPQAVIPNFVQQGMMQGRAEDAMFFVRMLYSCLVDADYLDTETFMEGEAREQNHTSMQQLWDKLQCYISGWFPPKSELNKQRCKILEHCMQEGEMQSRGLFSLTVPTGGGKTVASLAFALAHARKHGLGRVIYVIPYTSIIEQTAEVFREILGADNVLEHHSNVLYDMEGEANADNIRLAKATENWDMPVIVTTAVQFFESLYACRSSQCRKLHNIADSVVIFDEAQMMPIPYLRPCVHAISQLVAHYGVSAVLCTATQPVLNPIFREFLPDVTMTELCPPEMCQWEVFRRVSFRQVGKLTWDEVVEGLNAHAQVLCIVNTRNSAQQLFERLEGEGTFHLSTLMYPAHRREQLKEIRHRLSEGLPCRVVSTSLIEAGVDVDFPAVYREISGLDSILQAAGRCNREGKRPVQDSVVTIFTGEDNIPPLFQMAIGAGKAVMQHHPDIASREAIHEYFHQLLDLKGKEAQDMQRILPVMRTELFPFRTVAERFHLIDSPTRTVYIPLGKGAELIERFRSGERHQGLFRQLGQYGVSVYERHFAGLNQAGDLELLENGTAILCNLALYSEQTGLSLEADSGKALFV